MAESLIKVLPDTSIFIPWINQGITHPSIKIADGIPILYLSSIVIEEMYAGAWDTRTERLLDKLYNTFEGVGRLVTPLPFEWQRAGKILAKIGRKYGVTQQALARLTHDLLIALSARRIGAIILTANLKDFKRLQEFVSVSAYGIS